MPRALIITANGSAVFRNVQLYAIVPWVDPGKCTVNVLVRRLPTEVGYLPTLYLRVWQGIRHRPKFDVLYCLIAALVRESHYSAIGDTSLRENIATSREHNASTLSARTV